MEVVTLAPAHEHCIVPKMWIRANMLSEGNGKQSFWLSVFVSPCVMAVEPTKMCFIYGGSQDIVGRLDGKAHPECLHLPQLFPGVLPLLNSFPCHPLSLLCLCHSLCAPSRFSFAMYLLHYQLMSLRWWGLAPGRCAGPQANITPPLLHLVLQCYNCFTQTH